MNQLDVYYRALFELSKLRDINRECANYRRAVASADQENASITVKRVSCTVEEDWLCAIEQGLVHIEKAIKEERQFIYSNGEVIPIEKVKNVSPESVRHLAKHSNLIGKQEAGEDIVPDHLYTVERLNDYAVYENRFLYMLLCYLRDFITLRYNKILELSNKYDGSLKINKNVVKGRQKTVISLNLRDERKDDLYLREHNPAKNAIDRMDLMLKTVLSFLSTPLMECAAKAALLKPPITKTNVLKMDNNFKGAVALYDYIIAYDRPGYVCEERIDEISPFSDDLAEDFSELISLLVFLTYENGLSMKSELKEEFEKEEQRRKQEEIRLKAERLEALARKIRNSDSDAMEYALAAEKHIKLLTSELSKIPALEADLAKTKEERDALEISLVECNGEIERLNIFISEREAQYKEELDRVRADCDERIHANLIKHEKDMHELERSFSESIESINQDAQNMRNEMQGEIDALRAELAQKEQSISELSDAIRRLDEEKAVSEAQLKAIRAEQGLLLPDGSLDDKKSFDKIEQEYQAFTRFYKKQWGYTKKNIRKNILNLKFLKEKNGQDNEP